MTHAKTMPGARCALAVTLLLIVTSAAMAQNKNTQLLGRFDPEQSYNDVWGHKDPATGKEYAILGSRNGTYIVDCSNPSQPVQKGYFDRSLSGWAASTWRDMKVHKAHAFVVTEGGAGMQIIDLTNPASPQYVKTWGANIWRNAHNIFLDAKRGNVYVCGTRNGMHIIDVNTDPKNPVLLHTFVVPYVHDGYADDGIGHLSDINANNYVIVDFRNLPSTSTIASVRAPSRLVHNNWVSLDKKVSVTTNETNGGPIAVWDVSNISQPTVITQIRAGVIPHNAFIRDRICLSSYYGDGFQAHNISNPGSTTSLSAIASYDTSSAWGCYPYNDSGNIYLSDINNGLYILKSKVSAARYGNGTPGTGNVTPREYLFGPTFIGNPDFAFKVIDARPNAGATLMLGFQRANLNVSGLEVLVVPAALLPATTNGQGEASIPIAVPNQPALDGVKMMAQWFINDPNGALGLAASRAAEFVFFQK